jgi:membrane-bound ClpP family serine protease
MIPATIIFLIVLGGFLLVLEFLFLPGLVAGIIGFLLQVAGVWTSFHYFGNGNGLAVMGATVVLDGVMFWLLFKTGVWKRLSLQTELKGRMNTLDETPVAVGDTGITSSRLAPAGKANINGHFVEVHSFSGQFIDVQVSVEVVKVEHGKISVRPLS